MKDCIFNSRENRLLKYIGIPYVTGSSAFNGCDCWGLIRLFYRMELNIFLPNYTDFAYNRDVFSQTSVPAPYNIALIAHDGDALDHCGMLVAEGLLHSLSTTGSVLSRVSVWESKIRGWYVFDGGAA